MVFLTEGKNNYYQSRSAPFKAYKSSEQIFQVFHRTSALKSPRLIYLLSCFHSSAASLQYTAAQSTISKENWIEQYEYKTKKGGIQREHMDLNPVFRTFYVDSFFFIIMSETRILTNIVWVKMDSLSTNSAKEKDFRFFKRNKHANFLPVQKDPAKCSL